ncbi:MAG TPA: hypothetical protein VN843_05370, partial [Anaerolineales bacterium]|nr:hypothetical protein [Anaerolineales bacterium]
GVAPISGQVLYPRIIQMLDYFFALLAFFSISIWIPLFAELGKEFFQSGTLVSFLIINGVFTLLTMSIIFFIRRALVQREGRLASLGWLTASLFWIGVIIFIQSFYLLAIIGGAADMIVAIDSTEDMRGSVSMFMPCSCTLGVMLITLFSLGNWRDLTRWFPAR